MDVRRGDIFWVDLDVYNDKVNNSSLQRSLRPCIIISNEKNNLYSPTVNAYAITSRTKNNIPVHVTIGTECGLMKESVVLVEQMITIDKRTMLKSKIGTASAEIMDEIEYAALIQGQFSERSLIKYLKKLNQKRDLQFAF